VKKVEQYYDQNAQQEWDRLDRHRIEFQVTLRALAEFLPAVPAALIDVGGGPGRYAIHLAGQGYRVTLVDLSNGNLALARQKAALADVKLEAFVQANALDLSTFPEAGFDSVLLLGPLYHLHTPEERRMALGQVRRLLKPGGLIFASVITRFAGFRDAAINGYSFVLDDPAYSERLLATGIHDNGVGFTDAYFAHPDEVIPLCASAGFTTLRGHPGGARAICKFPGWRRPRFLAGDQLPHGPGTILAGRLGPFVVHRAERRLSPGESA
jgi:S-adenosylmethionine-dependent methyltransferase